MGVVPMLSARQRKCSLENSIFIGKFKSFRETES